VSNPSVQREAYPDPEDRRDLEHISTTVARMLIGSCVGCGVSGMEEVLYPVGEDNLTFFSGDDLCEKCAINHGVL
jgi:hypothetical protein